MKPLYIRYTFPLLTGLLVLLATQAAFAQSERKLTRQGNGHYDTNQFADAEASYRKALEENNMMTEGNFNLGDALYKQERYEDAANQFQLIAESTEDPELRAKAYHNLGNTFLKAKQLKPSIEAYKNALRIDPYDQDTRYNLAYAQALLKKEEQENKEQKKEQKKDNKDQNEENKDEEQKQQEQEEQQKDQQEQKDQEQQKKDQQEKEEQEQKKDKGQDGEEQKDKEQQEQQQKDQQNEDNGEGQELREQQLSKEEAMRVLEALKREEQKVREKLELEKAKSRNVNVEKDW